MNAASPEVRAQMEAGQIILQPRDTTDEIEGKSRSGGMKEKKRQNRK